MWIICGLGNPGEKYIHTRHNVGFMFVEQIIRNNNFELLKKDKSKEIYKGFFKNNQCLICKPLSFMNNSGYVLEKIIKFYKIPKSKILVVHDDLDLKTGKVKVKIGGGNGGHNGLVNIDKMIGVNYNRLRIGIGHPGIKNLVSKYVTEKFKKNELDLFISILNIIDEHIDLIFTDKQLFLNKISIKSKILYNGI